MDIREVVKAFTAVDAYGHPYTVPKCAMVSSVGDGSGFNGRISEAPDRGAGWVRLPARPPCRVYRLATVLLLQSRSVRFDSSTRYHFGSLA